MEILTSFPRIVEFILRDLDPSLLQNIILGILAIFIPFAIVFLANVLNSEKQRNEFEKMVLREEVLNTKLVFVWSLLGIIVLAFFTGKDISVLKKIIALSLSGIIFLKLSGPFWKILKFSDGQQDEFEISFLKKLNFSKFCPCKNDAKAEKMIRAWSSFWEGKTISRHKEIIEIFYSHIDGAMENKKYDTAVSLAKVYESNFLRMTVSVMSEKVLPKSLEWYEKSLEVRLDWEKQRENHRSSPKKFLSKFRLGSRKKDYLLWGCRYFQNEFLKSVILNLLFSREGHAPLFTFFDKYIKKKEMEKNFKFIELFFRTFCNIFFESRHDTTEESIMWEEDFPEHWKITMANSKTYIPKVIFRNFLRWACPRIVYEKPTKIDGALIGVTTGIFPGVDNQLLSSFLVLFCSGNLSSAIQKKLPFHFSNSYNFFPDESKEENAKKIEEEKKLQKEETLNIILEYFGNSKLIAACEKDISPEVIQHGEQYSAEQKKLFLPKLQKLHDELNSKKIDDLCKKSEDYQTQGDNFRELIDSLIEKVS